jgi:FtsH-binding integral membrane protein
MSNYPQPPPSYGSAGSPSKPATHSPRRDGASPPLLGGPSAQRSGAGAIYDQPYHDDLPDDFKYGVSVSESSPEIRNAFVRKVYSILFCQILATTIVSGFLSQSSSAVFWVQTHTWAFYVPLVATFINLGVLFWKRHSHPLNLVLLSTFTLLEAFTLGIGIAFYDNVIILQALIITLGVFLGLTLFTFQSKYDFSGMGPFLFGGLIALVVTGFVGVFLPFSRTFDLIMAIGGCLLFSGYIVYDTYMINKRMSPDEYIMASISLYLDFLNLFINILRLLNDTER